MKKVLALILTAASLLALYTTAQAQTPEEIVQKMLNQMDRTSVEGFSMDFILKMPIIGEVASHNKVLGDKIRMEIIGKDKASISWHDADTQWDYEQETGEITISAYTPSESASNGKSDLSGFQSLAEGYKLKLVQETDEAWYIKCKKMASNKDKDAPKSQDLAVSKATYLPLYMRTKGPFIKISIENFAIGVTEDEVTFNPAEFPNATIVDKR